MQCVAALQCTGFCARLIKGISCLLEKTVISQYAVHPAFLRLHCNQIVCLLTHSKSDRVTPSKCLKM